MFYYNINGLFVLFYLVDEKRNQWRLTAYKIGVNGGWCRLFTKLKCNTSPLEHFRECKNKFRNKHLTQITQ